MSQDHQTTVSHVTGTVLGFGALVYQNALSLLGALLVAVAPSLANTAAKALMDWSARRHDARLRALEDRAVVAETRAKHAEAELERLRIQRADG